MKHTLEQVVQPFPKLVTDTHTIVFHPDERSGWYHWEVYAHNPLRGIGGGSSPSFDSAITTAMREHNIEIKH